jgi:hypothetical protein
MMFSRRKVTCLTLNRITTILAVISIAVVLAIPEKSPAETARTSEINECRSNEILTWGDGKDRPAGTDLLKFAYNHTGGPDWLTADAAAAMVAKAAAAWSQCGVRTQMVPWNSNLEQHKDQIFVQWNEKESLGNFGLANFSRRTLSLGPKAFELLRTRNPAHDAKETLQMVISHEMGHLFGLMAHSRRCVDVLSYYHNGKGESCFSRDPSWKSRVAEYRSMMPTACDIKRCRIANGKPPLPE